MTAGPSLFGVSGRSNRDTTKRSHWGKNEFNSSFPTALLCYMASKKVKPVYLVLNDELGIDHSSIAVSKLFGATTGVPRRPARKPDCGAPWKRL